MSSETSARHVSARREAAFIEEVLFVVTLYERALSQSQSWNSLESYFSSVGLRGDLFIYDNSPKSQVLIRSPHMTTHYQHDATNGGISAACNAAYQFARNGGKKWLLLFDQDTSLGLESMAQFAAAIDANPSHGLFAPIVRDAVGILSPFRFSNGRGIRVSTFSSNSLLLDTFRAVNAGLLISCDLFGKAGGYVEAVALDFSDIAFLEKAKPVCGHICLVDTTLQQDFSGTSRADRQTTVERFWKYCTGAHAFAREFGRGEIRRVAFLRAIKLSIRWRHLEFLKIYFKTWNR